LDCVFANDLRAAASVAVQALQMNLRPAKHIYEVRPSKYSQTFDLISKVLPLGRAAGFLDVAAAVRRAKAYSDSHAAVIRVYDQAGNLIETHEHKGDFTTGP
jgi:hypothetical protein